MARAGASARAQRDERRAEFERQLVAALERLIVVEPRFTELNLTRLLDEAGLSRTSFYKYFDSKADVLVVWLDGTVGRLLDAPRPGAGSSAPTRENLLLTMEEISNVYRAELPLIAAVYETAAHDYDLRAHVAGALGEMEARVRRHILRGRREGWVNADIEPGPMAAWIIALCESGLRHIVGPAKPSDVPAALDAWADTIWLTLYAPAARAGA
jgi:AcrR family transcriptional regulator